MNFSPFGGHFSTTIPTIHQFAAKFTHENTNNALCPQDSNSNRYTANGVPSFTQHHTATPSQQHMVNNKYQSANYLNQTIYGHQNIRQQDKRYDHQELAQELCAAMQQQQQQTQQPPPQAQPPPQPQQQPPPQQQTPQQDKQQNDKVKQESQDDRNRSHQVQTTQHQQTVQSLQQIGSMPSAWSSLPGTTVADYLSHLPASTLPLSLHHFLKYSAETIKKETSQQQQLGANDAANINLLHNNALQTSNLAAANLNLNTMNTVSNNLLGTNTINTLNTLTTINTSQLQSGIGTTKKKKKKKVEKEKKPRPKPGEIRLTTALDGSTLYCCPECHMAYPEKELLEQHLVGHTLERRFVCDICGAGLKRKDHLTRHKQSHNPERPYVCTVCLKAFKRKEQLTLHFVIHSGEKRHICTECGKGFYRKDHLRKHTRSHIARRVKAELSQQGTSTTGSLQLQVAAPASTSTTTTSGIL